MCCYVPKLYRNLLFEQINSLVDLEQANSALQIRDFQATKAPTNKQTKANVHLDWKYRCLGANVQFAALLLATTAYLLA
jgi:hypothetical protein